MMKRRPTLLYRWDAPVCAVCEFVILMMCDPEDCDPLVADRGPRAHSHGVQDPKEAEYEAF
jgi:hypothetical protein